jgi:hypothetical protein
MGTTEWGESRIRAQQAAIAGDYRKEQFESLTASIKAADALVSRGYEKLAGETAELKGRAVDAVARFQASQHAGEGAQRTRSTVEMAKLMVNAPIDFAKAAYAPDENLLRDVRMAANPSGDAGTRNPLIAEKAWQTFYTVATPGAGNLWGTYQAMEDAYGKDTNSLAADGDLAAARQRVLAQIDTEKGAAAGFGERYRAFTDIDGAWDNFLKRNPHLDPNADATYDAFEADHGIKNRLAKVQDTPFIAQLQKTIADEKSYEKELYRTDALTGIKAAEDARDREIDLRNKIGGPTEEPPGLTEDTDRDLMAAWLKRPEIQAWAKQNGLRVGRVEEISEQMKADIASGKIPRASATKYGVYTDGPDDHRAVDFAYNQMKRTPERDIFRRAGISRRAGPETIVEVEVGLDPALYQDPETKQFVKNTKTGKYVKLADVDALGVEDVEFVAEPPPVTVHRGVRRDMLVNDAAGSVRFVNEESGKEEYVNPDIIRRINEPGLRSDATKDGLADQIGKGVAKRAADKAGLETNENDMDIGEKPDQRRAFFQQYPGTSKGSSVQARRERVEDIRRDLPIVPDAALDERLRPNKNTDAFVGEHAQRAKASDTASASMDVTDRRQQPGLTPPAMITPPPGPANGTPIPRAKVGTTDGATIEPPAAAKVQNDATTPSTTTPTASTTTDPRRALFGKKKPPETGANAGP